MKCCNDFLHSDLQGADALVGLIHFQSPVVRENSTVEVTGEGVAHPFDALAGVPA